MNKSTTQMRSMPKTLTGVVDDGTREIPLVNKFGKLICKVYIRPSDLSIYDRYKEVVKHFDSIVAPLANLSINADGTADSAPDWDVLKTAESELKKQLNYLFDMDEADDIFATRNPFSSVGGEFFCTRVILALGGVIEEAIREEAKISEERVAEYLTDTEGNNAGATSENADG